MHARHPTRYVHVVFTLPRELAPLPSVGIGIRTESALPCRLGVTETDAGTGRVVPLDETVMIVLESSMA